MFAFGKNRELLQKLENYLSIVTQTVASLEEAVRHCVIHGIDEHYRVLAQRTHEYESDADDIRRAIELDMFKKSLLPESRQDLLSMIEVIDHIPNCAEAISNMILYQQTLPHPRIHQELTELLDISSQTAEFVAKAAINCFGKTDQVMDLYNKVDINETLGDKLEYQMIRKVFDLDIDTAEKILQRDLIKLCGDLCDHCEQSLDLIVITSIKRQV